MEELRAILIAHAKRYPLMQPTDAVKLIYQNEFGGGHLIRDEEACLNYLRREYADLEKDPSAQLYEEIGNGIVRVNLAAVKPNDLGQIGRDFIRSAAEHAGTMDSFLQKLDVLRKLTLEDTFSFDSQKLENYSFEYGNQNYPIVSHSEAYREEYRPAYRIILNKKSGVALNRVTPPDSILTISDGYGTELYFQKRLIPEIDMMAETICFSPKTYWGVYGPSWTK